VRTPAADTDSLPLLVDNLRTTFELDGVSLLGREGEGWLPVATAGHPAPVSPEDGETFSVDSETVLVVVGAALTSEDRVIIAAFAGQAAAVLEARRLREEAAEMDVVAQGDALRTGLLRSVSHDLRTPLAGIKASVTSLLQDDVSWSPHQEHEFLTTIDEECDRLNRLVTNLLDASRLQSGAMSPRRVPVAIDDVVAAALASLPLADVPLDVELSDELPQVEADPVLLERVVANLVSNALRYSPPGARVRLTGGAVGDRVELLVIDRGPGIRPAQRVGALRPFQRLGDEDPALGVGLGLAVAHGFTELLGGELLLDDTPGGGLTVTVSLPRSAET
jgi:two-component system sensor histidine kinase KdpD